jgi:hypothetical protein
LDNNRVPRSCTEQSTCGCLTQVSMKTMSTQTPMTGLKPRRSTRIHMVNQVDETNNRGPKVVHRSESECNNPEMHKAIPQPSTVCKHSLRWPVEEERTNAYMQLPCGCVLPSRCCL